MNRRKPRDTQMVKCYRMEFALKQRFGVLENHQWSLEQCQELAKQIWAAENMPASKMPQVSKSRSTYRSVYKWSRNHIYLSKQGLNPYTVIHELVHAIDWHSGWTSAWHGAQFVKTVFSLVPRYIPEIIPLSFVELQDHARSMGVRVEE